jgi:hypothetical protein
MSNSNAQKGEKIPREEPIFPNGSSSVTIRIVCDRDPVIMIVESRFSVELGAHVDRDHDHLLREFMEASDE